MERESVMRRIALKKTQPKHKDALTGESAAKLLGISRQRVSQLFNAWKKKNGGNVETPKPEPVKEIPVGVIPEEVGPVETPKNLDEVLAPIGGSGSAPPESKPAATPAPDTSKAGEQAPPIDPEDAAAGRELIRWMRRGLTEFTCRFILGMKKDDPRLQEMREENEFLKLSIKRNSEKAAPLGSLTKGFLGLLIGSTIEIVRGFFIVGDNGGVPSKVTPHEEVEKPREESPKDNADRPDEPSPRMSLEEKIKRMNGGG